MVSTVIAEEVGPRPLLAYLLLHHSAGAADLARSLRRDGEQIERSLSRLARRGLVTACDGHYEIAPSRRLAVADYAEGALPLRELVRP